MEERTVASSRHSGVAVCLWPYRDVRQCHDQEIGKTSEVKRPYSGQLLAPAIC